MAKGKEIGIVLVILLFIFLLSKGMLFSTTTTCSETDNGKSPYIKGTLTQSNGVKIDDRCDSPTTLREYYCTADGGIGSFQMTCPEGCVSGACYYCKPIWQCTDWSSCSNGQQTRICTDSNKCGVMTNKPIESQSCTSTSYCGNGICEQGELIQCITTPCNQPCEADCGQVCTQEAGQLCNPTTKQVIGYTDGCQKSNYINQGYTADLSVCNQLPTCITNSQLLEHINHWVNNQMTNQELLNTINQWVNC